MAEVPTTEDLVRRAQAGDREAAGEIARRFADRVRARVHGRLDPRIRPRTDTEDILQSTFTLAWEDLRGFTWRGEEALLAWLTTIAERQVLHEARRHRSRKRDARRDRPLEAAGAVPTGQTSPTQAAVRGELTAGLPAALARLSEEERRAVELRSFRGLTFEAMAREMGLPGRAAASRLFESALERLGEVLDPKEGPDI